MDWSGCEIVESVPEKVSGVPIIRGTRVPADLVLDNHGAGESVQDIAYNFDLSVDDIHAVLAYASSHQPALRP